MVAERDAYEGAMKRIAARGLERCEAPDPRGPAGPAAMQVLGEELGRLVEVVSQLETRLSWVLSPEGPTTASGGGEKLRTRSPLAEGLAGYHAVVVSVKGQLLSVLDRLEV